MPRGNLRQTSRPPALPLLGRALQLRDLGERREDAAIGRLVCQCALVQVIDVVRVDARELRRESLLLLGRQLVHLLGQVPLPGRLVLRAQRRERIAVHPATGRPQPPVAGGYS